MKGKAANNESKRKLLAAGWEPKERGGLVVWRPPGGVGGWYSQSVALEMSQAEKIEDRAGEEEREGWPQ